MKTTVICPECNTALRSFQATYTNVEITFNHAHFSNRGIVDYDEKDYELVIPGTIQMEYTCPVCAADITRQVDGIENANWKGGN